MRFRDFMLWRLEGNKIAERWTTVTWSANLTS
jgi:hypothetical protein